MRCYTLEHHFTNECPKPRDFKVCSECSNEGHVWHQCQEPHKKCLNCGENHSAMAMKCNKRKQILKEKRNEEIERQKMTYSTISQVNVPAKMPSYKMPIITKEELLKINICVAHAQAKNHQNPGTYSYELNKVLKANSLPTIIIPDDSDKTTGSLYTEQSIGAISTDVESVESEIRATTPNLSRQSSSESMKEKKLDSTAIGLEFYTIREKGWPKNCTTEDIVKGIQNNKFKFRYTDNKFSEEQILRKTRKGEIKLSNCWFSVEADEYRKIRSGLYQERSPVESRDPRLAKRAYD